VAAASLLPCALPHAAQRLCFSLLLPGLLPQDAQRCGECALLLLWGSMSPLHAPRKHTDVGHHRHACESEVVCLLGVQPGVYLCLLHVHAGRWSTTQHVIMSVATLLACHSVHMCQKACASAQQSYYPQNMLPVLTATEAQYSGGTASVTLHARVVHHQRDSPKHCMHIPDKEGSRCSIRVIRDVDAALVSAASGAQPQPPPLKLQDRRDSC
jgi:hypothetical protein